MDNQKDTEKLTSSLGSKEDADRQVSSNHGRDMSSDFTTYQLF